MIFLELSFYMNLAIFVGKFKCIRTKVEKDLLESLLVSNDPIVLTETNHFRRRLNSFYDCFVFKDFKNLLDSILDVKLLKILHEVVLVIRQYRVIKHIMHKIVYKFGRWSHFERVCNQSF